MRFRAFFGELGRAGCNLFWAAYYLFFALFFLTRAFRPSDLILPLFLAAENLVPGMYFSVRGRATRTFWNWRAVAVCGICLLTPFLLTGRGNPALEIGVYVQVLGLAIAIGGYASLKTSVAVLPALRQIRQNGLYGLCRHPVYLGHLVMFTGYLLSYPELFNFGLFGVWAAALMGRIVLEEQILSEDPAYAAYQARVRWKLLPGLF